MKTIALALATIVTGCGGVDPCATKSPAGEYNCSNQYETNCDLCTKLYLWDCKCAEGDATCYITHHDPYHINKYLQPGDDYGNYTIQLREDSCSDTVTAPFITDTTGLEKRMTENGNATIGATCKMQLADTALTSWDTSFMVVGHYNMMCGNEPGLAPRPLCQVTVTTLCNNKSGGNPDMPR